MESAFFEEALWTTRAVLASVQPPPATSTCGLNYGTMHKSLFSSSSRLCNYLEELVCFPLMLSPPINVVLVAANCGKKLSRQRYHAIILWWCVVCICSSCGGQRLKYEWRASVGFVNSDKNPEKFWRVHCNGWCDTNTNVQRIKVKLKTSLNILMNDSSRLWGSIVVVSFGLQGVVEWWQNDHGDGYLPGFSLTVIVSVAAVRWPQRREGPSVNRKEQRQ